MNRGKEFEKRVVIDFKESIPDSRVSRIKDQMTGFKGSQNPSDFKVYVYPYSYWLEAKSIQGNTFNVKFRQYDKLVEMWKEGITGEFIGLVIWFVSHDKAVYVPIETFYKLKQEGKKSFHINMLGDSNYPSFEIPSEKLRVYLKLDFSNFTEDVKGLKV